MIKIAITGPESTGKSSLSQALARHYQAGWVPEYAREFLNHLKRPYEYDDLLTIARGQIELEDKYSKNTNRYLFCDTDLLVIKIWSEYRFGKVHPFILEEYRKRQYDLVLLMDIDLPWQYDPQREHPDKGAFFFEWYRRELNSLRANYHIISGLDNARITNAIKIIDQEFH